MRPPKGWTAEAVETRVRVKLPFPAPTVQTVPPEAVLDLLLAEAGATKPRRDAVDRRVLELIRQGRGRLIDSQEDVGGWPPLEAASPPLDTDADGMPDVWEKQYGFDPNNPSDAAQDFDEDGYTNIEEYLNGTDPTRPQRWVPPRVMDPDPLKASSSASIVITLHGVSANRPVYYTVDGREPTEADLRYTGPFIAHLPAHVRARVMLLSDSEFTTSAFAWYEAPLALPAVTPQAAWRPGLLMRQYQATAWVESPPLETLPPVATDTIAHLELMRWRDEPEIALWFEGYLRVAETGRYWFFLEADPRSRLWIDGQVVAHGRAPEAGPFGVVLAAGWHSLRLLLVRENERAPVQVRWAGPNQPLQSLTQARFFVETTKP